MRSKLITTEINFLLTTDNLFYTTFPNSDIFMDDAYLI
jgi:hypothetical protein